MRLVTETVPAGLERMEDRVGRLREAFQGELLGVLDRLLTASAAEADAAAEKARAAGRIALDAALIELEQRARQCNDLTELVRQLETQVEELRVALRLQERLASEYESKMHAAHMELDTERARVRGLTRRLEAQVSERASLLTALKTVQQACALAEAKSEAFEVGGPRAEEQSDHETPPDVHDQSAETTGVDGAGANDPSAADSEMRDAATSAPTGSMSARKLTFVGTDQRRTVEVPPSLTPYTKPLFPRETPRTGHPSGVKTEEGPTRKPRSRTTL